MSRSPHMTGRRQPESTDETRTAADLLDDDGNIDRSAVASIANAGTHREGRVFGDEITEIRRRLLGGETVREIAEDIDRGYQTVRHHARGTREHPHGDEPDIGVLEYGPGGWEVADE